MSDAPTPETDAMAFTEDCEDSSARIFSIREHDGRDVSWDAEYQGSLVPSDFARHLERERDAARMSKIRINTIRIDELNRADQMINDLEAQRDKLRAINAELVEALEGLCDFSEEAGFPTTRARSALAKAKETP